MSLVVLTILKVFPKMFHSAVGEGVRTWQEGGGGVVKDWG